MCGDFSFLIRESRLVGYAMWIDCKQPAMLISS